jgi:hypothetical protein
MFFLDDRFEERRVRWGDAIRADRLATAEFTSENGNWHRGGVPEARLFLLWWRFNGRR